MSIALTIFLLVFLGELIQWIGQSVLLELVRTFARKSIIGPPADVPLR